MDYYTLSRNSPFSPLSLIPFGASHFFFSDSFSVLHASLATHSGENDMTIYKMENIPQHADT